MRDRSPPARALRRRVSLFRSVIVPLGDNCLAPPRETVPNAQGFTQYRQLAGGPPDSNRDAVSSKGTQEREALRAARCRAVNAHARSAILARAPRSIRALCSSTVP